MTDRWKVLKSLLDHEAFSAEQAIALPELDVDPLLLKDLTSPLAMPRVNRSKGKYFLHPTSVSALKGMLQMAELEGE